MPGGYFVTDAQMAAIEAQVTSCRFRRDELLARRSAACRYIGEQGRAIGEYAAAMQAAREDDRSACLEARARLLWLAGGGTLAGVAIGAVLGVVAR